MAQAWLGRVAAKILIAAVLITVAVPIGLQAQGGEDADALGDKVELGALDGRSGFSSLSESMKKHSALHSGHWRSRSAYTDRTTGWW